MKILHIAHNTFRETIRDRVLRVIVGLCFAVFLVSRGVAEISLGQELKIIADFSLDAIDLFGMTLCVFVGASLIYKELDKHTLYTVVSCPMSRWEFIVGKYLGMNATLGVCVCVMGVVFWIFFWLSGGIFNWKMLAAIAFIYIGLIMLNAIAVFFSTMASPVMSAVFTLAIWLAGRGSYELKYLADSYVGITKDLLMAIYYLLPNFANFVLKSNAVHNLPVDKPWQTFLGAIAYSLVYSALMIYLASLIFKKRNL